MFLFTLTTRPVLPDPPYNAATGKSLGPNRPDNFGRPQITKENPELPLELTVTEKLGHPGCLLDEIVVKIGKPKLVNELSLLELLKRALGIKKNE